LISIVVYPCNTVTPDLLSAVDTAVKAAWRRATGSTIDDHGARFGSIPAGAPPGAAKPVEQATPKAEPGPAGEQSVKRSKGDVAQLPNGPPLHAAETNTPDRHDGLAQHRSGQGWLWPRSHWSATILRHGRKFGHHFVHKHVNIGKRIPRASKGLRRTGGGSHVLASMLWAVVHGWMVAVQDPIRNSTSGSIRRCIEWVRAIYKQILKSGGEVDNPSRP
jgi:hypothetical protein